MTGWMKERDRLLEQTQAFVQRVAASTKLGAAPSVTAVGTAAVVIPAGASPEPASQSGQSPEAKSLILRPQPAVAPPSLAEPHPVAAPKSKVAPLSERADITRRVAAFRAHQGRLTLERDRYYEATKARIKTVLDNPTTSRR